MHSLPVLLRLRDRPVILLGSSEAAQAKRRLIERVGGHPVDESDKAARLAIIVMEDDAEAIGAVKRLKARGILVNAADRPEHCDFTLPAIVDRDPVLVAIGTGGASAGLAKALRLLIEAMLPPNLGGLARAMADRRSRIRARWAKPNERRQAIDAAFAPGGPLDPLSGADADAADRWLEQQDDIPSAAFETIQLRSADPDDLTLREARWLGRADRIFHQPDIPTMILDRARADATRYPSVIPPETGVAGFTLWIRWSA